MFQKLLICVGLPLLLANSTTPGAKADELFTGSQSGLCCFNVDLHQVSSTDVNVNVYLTSGALYFAHSGKTNHPAFAFNLFNDPTITISNPTPGWVSHLSKVTTNGPALGTFDYYFTAPGKGTSAKANMLQFNVNDSHGIVLSDFIANANGYYFVADILDKYGNTGLSAISKGAPSPVPEPSSLLLLGSGILGLAATLRRRMFA